MEWDDVQPLEVNDIVTVKQDDDLWLMCQVTHLGSETKDALPAPCDWITARVIDQPHDDEQWEELGVHHKGLVCFQVRHVEEVG